MLSAFLTAAAENTVLPSLSFISIAAPADMLKPEADC